MASLIRVRLSSHWLIEKKYILSQLIDFLIDGATLTFEVDDALHHTIEVMLEAVPGKLVFQSHFFNQPESGILTPPKNSKKYPRNLSVRKDEDSFDLIGLADGAQHAPAVSVSSSEYTINIDILGTSFVLMTQLEDFHSINRDQHSRSRLQTSFLGREGLEKRPLIEEYLEFLRQLIKIVWPTLLIKRTDFQIHLSHDIDRPWAFRGATPKKFIRSLGRDLFDFRDPGLTLKQIGSKLSGGIDPYWTFNILMDFEESLGLRGHYYFIPKSRDPQFDSNYTLDDPEISKLIQEIHARGHKLGVHPSYLSSERPDFLNEEFQIFSKKMKELGIENRGLEGRQHYLKWNPKTSWRDWQNSGAVRDLSIGFSESPGFKAGLCRPYRTFDLQNREELQLEELPLLIMDTSLPASTFSNEDRLLKIGQIASSCRRYSGMCTILIHNNRISSQRERSFWFDMLKAMV